MATDVSAPLPDVSLQPKHTVTVTFDDAGAIITGMNVYAVNVDTGEAVTIPVVPPLFAYGPSAGTEAPGHTP